MVSPRPSLNVVLDSIILTLETEISANFDVRRNVVPPWRVRQANSGSNSHMTSQDVNAKQSRKVASSVRFRHILHICGKNEKKIKHHIEEGTQESHPCVQDVLHPRLGKPRRGLQIMDTRMGFPRPSLNVMLDSVIPLLILDSVVTSSTSYFMI